MAHVDSSGTALAIAVKWGVKVATFNVSRPCRINVNEIRRVVWAVNAVHENCEIAGEAALRRDRRLEAAEELERRKTFAVTRECSSKLHRATTQPRIVLYVS